MKQLFNDKKLPYAECRENVAFPVSVRGSRPWAYPERVPLQGDPEPAFMCNETCRKAKCIGHNRLGAGKPSARLLQTLA